MRSTTTSADWSPTSWSAPGLVAGPDAFERCFAGVVESTDPSPHAAWRRFYCNTLLRASVAPAPGDHRTLRSPPSPDLRARRAAGARRAACSTSAAASRSFRCCWPRVASSASPQATPTPGTVALARRMAAELGLPVAFRPRRRDPVGCRSRRRASTPSRALHVLEHLPADRTCSALAGALPDGACAE